MFQTSFDILINKLLKATYKDKTLIDICKFRESGNIKHQSETKGYKIEDKR